MRTIEGELKPDGTIVLDGKPELPPGRVQVVLEPIPELPEGDPLFQRMKQIWADQQARGHVPRTKEEIDAEVRELRDEAESEFRDAERAGTTSEASEQG